MIFSAFINADEASEWVYSSALTAIKSGFVKIMQTELSQCVAQTFDNGQDQCYGVHLSSPQG